MVVLLVRHAEKLAGGADGLTAAGRERAALLASLLRSLRVSVVYHTDLVRSRQTVAPLLAPAPTGVNLREVPLADPQITVAGHIAAIANDLVTHPVDVAAYVGHSDTVPALIRSLGGPAIATLDDRAFDNLFVVQTGGAASVVCARLKYGTATPITPTH